MDPAQLDSVRGQLVPTVGARMAYVPERLPPEITYSSRLSNLLAEAQGALGRLDGLGLLLPNTSLLVTPYMRIEAVMSSRIEGTQTTVPQLLASEAADQDGDSGPDVQEVRNYLAALGKGLETMHELPLCNRLVRGLHEVLLNGVRGENRTPGEFRKLQIHVGPYVPPPANAVLPLMDEWEAFLADPPADMPVLVQCAIMHYQFEAIHPFLDGNGRIGRLLIVLLLCERGVIAEPLLYLSPYLEAHRREYFDRLLAVSEDGDWNGWVEFFLRGLLLQGRRTVECCREIVGLREELRAYVLERTQSPNALRLLDILFENPFVTAARVARCLDVTTQTGRNLLTQFESWGIIEQVAELKRGALQYCATRLLKVIERAAEPPGMTQTVS